MKLRQHETCSPLVRSERFYCIAGLWYFATRERLQVGPFDSQQQAEQQLAMFLRHVNEGGLYGQPQQLLMASDASRAVVERAFAGFAS